MARVGAFNLDAVQKARTNTMQRLLMGKSSSSLPGQESTSKDFLKAIVGGSDKSKASFKKGRKF